MIILTDWDRKGGRLARALKEAFEANDVKVLDGMRIKLAILVKKEVKDIESIPRYVARLRSFAER